MGKFCRGRLTKWCILEQRPKHSCPLGRMTDWKVTKNFEMTMVIYNNMVVTITMVISIPKEKVSGTDLEADCRIDRKKKV